MVKLGFMNVHLRNVQNLVVFSGLIQDLKLDIIGVVETWFQPDTSSHCMKQYFVENEFEWYGKERSNQNTNRGAGGIGLLVRKIGNQVSLIKFYDQFEGMWVKYGNDTDNILYIACLYLPPGVTDNKFVQCLESLEMDILNFRKVGKVIVFGDFNARVGNRESVIQSANGQYVLSRVVDDMDVSGTKAGK